MADEYFVRIDDPSRVELERLQIAKQVLLLTSQYLLVKDIRERKQHLLNHLRKQTKSVIDSFNYMEKILPHKDLLVEEVKNAVKQSDSTKKNAKKDSRTLTKSIPLAGNKLDKLQEAIALIEKKIDSLDL
ncbi:hypothetical protein K9M74_02170 [Candidatus Woesearchaeota archaeon]|nr:hypothetical protein [Candidatus Woesearchaeota archaeon]